MQTAQIKEIFTSIQGEGPYVGYKQMFVRFCGCNLNCEYCDTDFDPINSKEYTEEELIRKINSDKSIHSVSLTGGEPLMWVDFLDNVLPSLRTTVYLETNGTLVAELARIIEHIDIVAMDVKLNSVSKNGDLYKTHDEFLKLCKSKNKEVFIKVVFDSSITEEEIKNSAELASKYGVELILQPKMNGDNLAITKTDIERIFNKFTDLHKKTRLIPQTHKFIGVL